MPQSTNAVTHVALLIPAYCPSEVLLDVADAVLSQASGSPIDRILVVDDGSGPEFRTIFDNLSARPGVTIVRHAVDLGKGAALKTGFNHLLVTWPDLTGIVTADADGQHSARDVLKVAKQLSLQPGTAVLGVRQFRGDVPIRSRAGNRITRGVFRTFSGIDLADTQTGLRGWPRRYCEKFLTIPINGYDFELECLLQMKDEAQRPEPPVQMPIETIYINGNAGSHFNPLRDSMRIYFVFLRYCASAFSAALVDSAAFFSVFHATDSLAVSQAAGRLAAAAVAFALARSLVFKSHAQVILPLTKYLTLVTIMGFVSYNLIRSIHSYLGVPVLPSKLISEGLLFFGNFVVQRDIVFARTPERRRDEPAHQAGPVAEPKYTYAGKQQ